MKHALTLAFSVLIAAILAPVIACAAESSATPQSGKSFGSPEAAVAALAEAVQSTNRPALKEIFGPEAGELVNRDPVQATNEFGAFALALRQDTRLVRKSPTTCVLEVGGQAYPFPVPIVQRDDGWFFDTAAGKDEMLSRHIGANELATLKSMRAYPAAQREYASRDRDDSDVLKYAQKLRSSPGKKDGLYWSPDLDGEISPMGPLVAYAQREGYGKSAGQSDTPFQPYHGYYFKILTRQGTHAPGGKYNYVINGNMIAGFGLVAWPAEYGQTGIMTFIVNQRGRVYQKDLGARTGAIAAAMTEYDPDPSWQVSKD